MELSKEEERLIRTARESGLDPDELLDGAEASIEGKGKSTLTADKAREIAAKEIERREAARREQEQKAQRKREIDQQIAEAIRKKNPKFSDRKVAALTKEVFESFDDTVYGAKNAKEFVEAMTPIAERVVDRELEEMHATADSSNDAELDARLDAMKDAGVGKGVPGEGRGRGSGAGKPAELDERVGRGNLYVKPLDQGEIDMQLDADMAAFQKETGITISD